MSDEREPSRQLPGLTLRPRDESEGRKRRSLRHERLLSKIEYMPLGEIKPYERNARNHPKRQLDTLEKSYDANGFLMPIGIDQNNTIIWGHGRYEAAIRAGMKEVPVIKVTHLSSPEIRVLRLADNKAYDLGESDDEALALELQDLLEIDADLSPMGYEIPEMDLVIDRKLSRPKNSAEEDVPPIQELGESTSRLGDLWHADEHKVLCGNARNPADYEHLMGSERARMSLPDAPYNLETRFIGGRGRKKHPNFLEGSGELDTAGFRGLLDDTAVNLVKYTMLGSLHFWFMDFRHLFDLQTVCNARFTSLLSHCCWVKGSAGFGAPWRHQIEHILIYKNGDAPHLDNIKLGKFERNRSTAWFYEGANSPNPARRAELALHPTPKSVALLADAILDVSARRDIVLDPFSGSGSTLIAAEKTGRRARVLELDGKYVDVTVRRWQRYTGRQAIHAETGLTFDQMSDIRQSSVPLLPPPPGDREDAQ